MSKSHAKRFVGAAWALLSFQLVASVGAVAVTGLAAMHVSRMAADLEAARGPATAEAAQPAEQAARQTEGQAGEIGVADASRGITTDERPADGEPRPQEQATATPAVASCRMSDMMVRVPANVEWCDTGIDIRRGQRIAINAQGRWNYRGQPAFGPAGSGERINNTLYPRAPLAALIGRVGGEVFVIGQGGQSDAASEGRLYLSMNDVSGTFYDNAGYIDVYFQFPSATP